jgi:hypothetical protein
MATIIYTEPNLTPEEVAALRNEIKAWINGNGLAKIPQLFFTIVLENARMTKENNELRKELGIPARLSYKLPRKQ